MGAPDVDHELWQALYILQKIQVAKDEGCEPGYFTDDDINDLQTFLKIGEYV